MIAPDCRLTVLLRPIDQQLWLRVLTNQVAAADDLLGFTPCVLHHRRQRVPVRVRVAEDQKFHTGIVTARTIITVVKHSRTATMQNDVISCDRVRRLRRD